jgi:hypothetical protein
MIRDNRQIFEFTATDTDVEWLSAEHWEIPYTLQVLNEDGSWPAGDVIQVRVHNSPDQPASDDSGTQLGADVTAAGIVTVEAPFRWLKVIKSGEAASEETQTVYLFAHTRR